MRRLVSFISLFSVFGFSSAAYARPWLYISGFTHSGTAESCLNRAKEALERHGFTDDLAIDRYKGSSRNDGGYVEGRLSGSAVVAVIECDSSQGLTTLGVSGINNDMAFQKYKVLFDEEW